MSHRVSDPAPSSFEYIADKERERLKKKKACLRLLEIGEKMG
ncbi:uncharacterized protein G2W53_006430 [Senna tora]|uniref:Uncharacterized protein n=1 Tax=Senna tora TaxID=362788 RepID=A0A834X472_9FABA|nr:uncharacterized protein G2W53_006430 [Senna tora]